MAPRRKTFENKKLVIKQDPIPDVNMEDSPPVSDSDVSINLITYIIWQHIVLVIF